MKKKYESPLTRTFLVHSHVCSLTVGSVKVNDYNKGNDIYSGDMDDEPDPGRVNAQGNVDWNEW